jgi:hypothetical protein
MARSRLSLPRLPSLPRPRNTDALRDPWVQSLLVLGLIAVAGCVMWGLAWRGVARTVYVPLQLPWLISGGVAGLALLGLALAGWSIHLGRRQDAIHRAAVDDLVRTGATLAEELRSGRRALPNGRRLNS